MEDENNPEAVNPELDTTTPTPPAIGDTTTDTGDNSADTNPAPDNTTPVTEPDYKAQAENYKKAMEHEREARKKLQREAAERGTDNQGNQPTADPQDIWSNPEVQKLLIKQAESELKEGAKDLLDQYPNVPGNVKKAILKNPRGFINPNTTTVPLALIDIQDYLEEVDAELAGEATQAPTVRDVKVLGNNGPAKAADPDEVLASEAMKTPPEEWTTEQEAAVERLNARNRNKR
ncbi:MAG: hypothetical protein Q8909_20870 [Bacteroidota bacterium]|nr:hypothetical protein [Bacteroidota bacterium]